jgi:hypothetical protein
VPFVITAEGLGPDSKLSLNPKGFDPGLLEGYAAGRLAREAGRRSPSLRQEERAFLRFLSRINP